MLQSSPDKPHPGRARLSWALADFAREPFFSFVLSLAFPPFFVGVLASDPVRGTAWWGYGLSATSFTLILVAPVAGALADATGTRRPWLIGSLLLACMALTSLWFASAEPGRIIWVLASVGLAQLGIELSRIHTDSLLPGLMPAGETGRLSGLGVGLGFTASILYLGLGYGATLAGIADDVAARALSSGSGLWLVIFMLPCLLFCPQPVARKQSSLGRAVISGFSELSGLWARFMAQRGLRTFLFARMLYWDGTMCLFAFISIVAATQLGWRTGEVSVFGLLGLVAGAWSGLLAGRLEGMLGTRRTLTLAITGLVALTGALALVIAAAPPPAEGFSSFADFAYLALAVAACGMLGIIMAASRSLLVALADPQALGEAFGLYVMIGRASSFMAPLLVALSTMLTGEQRFGVFGVAALLLVAGLLLLRRVTVPVAYREARA